jgi:hypothetical protein
MIENSVQRRNHVMVTPGSRDDPVIATGHAGCMRSVL